MDHNVRKFANVLMVLVVIIRLETVNVPQGLWARNAWIHAQITNLASIVNRHATVEMVLSVIQHLVFANAQRDGLVLTVQKGFVQQVCLVKTVIKLVIVKWIIPKCMLFV
jgi:hypothetical protein